MENRQKAIQKKFLEDVEFLGLRFPNAEIADRTGYHKSHVSIYLSGKKIPSEKFLKTFYQVFFPNENNNNANEPIVPYMSTEEYIRTLLKQIKDKDSLIELLQERNKQLNEELVSMRPGKAGGRRRSA